MTIENKYIVLALNKWLDTNCFTPESKNLNYDMGIDFTLSEIRDIFEFAFKAGYEHALGDTNANRS